METSRDFKYQKLGDLLQRYIQRKGKLFICISGVSGAGKSYHANLIQTIFPFLTHLDQDDFYHLQGPYPIFTYSNGYLEENWDCPEVLDFERMNNAINRHINSGVIFSGFACCDEWFSNEIDYQILLHISEKTCLERRTEQGKANGANGEIVVRELVYPFYQQNLKRSKISYVINAERKSSNTLEKILYFLLRELENVIL